MGKTFRNPLFIAGFALVICSIVLGAPALAVPGIALLIVGWVRSNR